MTQVQNRKITRNTQQKELQIVNIQRNPYLVEYDKQRQLKESYKMSNYGMPKYRGQDAGTGKGQARKRRVAAKRRREMRRKRKLRLIGLSVAVCMCIGIFLYQAFTDRPQIDGSVPPAEVVNADSGVGISAQALQGIDIQGLEKSDFLRHPIWTEDFLTVNEYSRPGDALKEVKNIFVHYTANPGTSAAQNRSYFEQLKDTHERSASAHFIIGYEGERIQCIPLNEIAYAVQGRNEDSISIECCYTSADGSFTQETYDSLIELLRWLTDVYDLQEEDILRHYDCGGKKCPLYYAENEEEWEQLKRDVGNL